MKHLSFIVLAFFLVLVCSLALADYIYEVLEDGTARITGYDGTCGCCHSIGAGWLYSNGNNLNYTYPDSLDWLIN